MPLGSPSDGQLTSQLALQGQCQSGTPAPASGGGRRGRELLPFRPSRHTHPDSVWFFRNKHLIWVRFNTQVKQPCTAPHPTASAQPAPPQAAPPALGLLAGRMGPLSSRSVPARSSIRCRQRSKVVGGQAPLEAPEGSVTVCCFWQPGVGEGPMPTEGRV